MLVRVTDGPAPTVGIVVDGKPVEARLGDSVAAAMLAAGFVASRVTPVSGSARGAYCLMGVCFECIVSIDGVAGRQACLVPVRDGMQVVTGIGREAST